MGMLYSQVKLSVILDIVKATTVYPYAPNLTIVVVLLSDSFGRIRL